MTTDLPVMTAQDWRDFFYSLRPDDSEPVLIDAPSIEQADAMLEGAFANV